MAKKSRTKGYMGEYKFRKLCEAEGFNCVWTAEDVKAPDINLEGLKVEIKNRESVPASVYKWLSEKNADALAMKKNNKDWLVVMRKDLFFKFLKGEKKMAGSPRLRSGVAGQYTIC